MPWFGIGKVRVAGSNGLGNVIVTGYNGGMIRNGPDKNDSNNGNEHVGMQKRC